MLHLGVSPSLLVDVTGLVAANMTVNVIAIGLIVLGVVLFAITISFWRGSVEDPEVLAPLEVMQDRKFARADPIVRASLLSRVRGTAASTEPSPDAYVPVVSASVKAVTEDSVPVPVADVPPSPLLRAPRSEPKRPYRDPYPHDDDAVDVVPDVIDPLLNRQQRPQQ